MSEDRKDVLLKAAYDILQECHKGPYVKDALVVTAIWDDAECDGFCLMEEIGDLLGIPKRITVKVECIETGEIIKNFDCGTDFKRANKLEDSLILRTNLDKFHVYQSIEK